LGINLLNNKIDATNQFNRWDAALTGGIGYQFSNGINLTASYDYGLSKLDANKNGIPDFVEGMMGTADQNQAAPASNPFTAANPPRSEPIPVSPTITPDTSNGLTLALAGLFILLLCIAGAGAAWYFFLR